MAEITWLIRRGLLITYKSWDDPPSVPGGIFLCVFCIGSNEGLGWDQGS